MFAHNHIFNKYSDFALFVSISCSYSVKNV